jgi:mRNA-degrading endonuclease RelE of RelBE toxin-antitoxin system
LDSQKNRKLSKYFTALEKREIPEERNEKKRNGTYLPLRKLTVGRLCRLLLYLQWKTQRIGHKNVEYQDQEQVVERARGPKPHENSYATKLPKKC